MEDQSATDHSLPDGGYLAELGTIRVAFGSDDEMARVLNVDRYQIVRWRAGHSPSIEDGVRIRVLAEAVRRLLEFYDPSVIPGWFRADAGRGTRDDMFWQGAYDKLFLEIGDAGQGNFV